MSTAEKKSETDRYSPQEVAERFERTLRGALETPARHKERVQSTAVTRKGAESVTQNAHTQDSSGT